MYEDYKVYGPYKKPDGRMHVVLVHNKIKSKKTISYPRFRMECILNKQLEPHEDVHHIDGNVENNDDSNFRIINKSEHTSAHSTLRFKYTPEEWICVVCGRQWWATRQEIAQRISKEKRLNRKIEGPFCSRSCQGKICN